jgi:spermidine/putrescine transport system permease protein
VASVSAEPGRKRKRRPRADEGVWYPRWFWPSFAAPATLYLAIFFVLPFYVIVSVALGTVDVIFQAPLPVYQPWYWSTLYVRKVLGNAVGFQRPVYLRTFLFVLLASILCVLIGYAVAYYVSRFGGRRKGLYLALLIAPFFISYLMRMLAWINLLEPDGYMNKLMNAIPLVPHNVNWLAGNPVTLVLGLVYGYVPYMILPFYGFLDRIEQSLLEAGRDLGASPARTFFRVTLPLSKQAILAGVVIVTLPMFGDYYTHDLLSNSPKTTMVGNLLDSAVNSTGQGPQAAVLVLMLMLILLIPMIYYLRSTSRELRVG